VPEPLKSTTIVFVHGLFGWGPGELGGAPYWGDALSEIGEGFQPFEAKVGPIGSYHDRACELFAQIAGGAVDYGEAHSAAAGHSRFGKHFNSGFLPGWSANNPVILVGHSAGAHTCLQLQRLLALDYWGRGTSADWVEAVVSVAGVLNGTLLPYRFGCDKRSGRLTGLPSGVIAKALDVAALVAGLPVGTRNHFDLCLDHCTEGAETAEAAMERLDHGPFVAGDDNLAFDLTLQGCVKANAAFRTHPRTYYLSLVTDATTSGGFLGLPWPNRTRPVGSISPILLLSALYQAQEVQFDEPPVPGWGGGDLALEKWRANDGAVSSISQRHPFTARAEPLGGAQFLTGGALPERGRWLFDDLQTSFGRPFDHFDVTIGARLKPWMREPHREVYRRLGAALRGLRG
jgi:triacylglycerol lipase